MIKCLPYAEFEGKLRTARNIDPAVCYRCMATVTGKRRSKDFGNTMQTSACHLLAVDSIVTLPKTCADIGSTLSDV